jgi:exonuclease SbcC
MLPLRLEIRNFLAYRAPDALVFDGIHLACLTGANGAGKSSLLDAITWALWGEARSRDDDLIHQGQSEMRVALKFEQDGAVYEVVRRRSRRTRSVSELDFYRLPDDGAPIILSEASVRATQAAINRLLRLDYDTFVRSAFLKQGGSDAFTRLKPVERKEVLAKILGLERYEAYEAAAKAQGRKLDEQVAVTEGEIKAADAELAREPDIRARLMQAQAAQREALEALQAAETALEAVASAPDDLKAKRIEQTHLTQRLLDHERDLSGVERDIASAEKRLSDAEATAAQADQIAEGYAALKQAISQEQALAQKLDELRAYDAQIDACEREIAAARARLDAQISGVSARIVELTKQVEAGQPDELARLQADADALTLAENRRDELNAAMSALEKEEADLSAQNKALKAELDKLRAQLKKIQELKDKSVCPQCGQPLTPEHRDQVTREITEEGMQRKAQTEANEARLATLRGELGERKAAWEAATADVRRLGRAREKVGALQAVAQAAAQAADAQAAATAERDGLRALLAADDFAHSERERLARLRAERDAVGYDDAQHRAARRDLDAFRDYERRQTLLDSALRTLPDLQADAARARERKTRLIAAQAQTQTDLAAATEEIGRLQLLVIEFNTRKEEVDRQRRRERKAGEDVIVALQQLDALEAQRQRRAELVALAQARRDERAVYKELETAFGKKGIPAMIIETAIPELEAAANALLGRMTSGRMSLRLETQREKKSTDGVIETLDIQIADELGTRSYELFSGGETFRIDFALRVALSQMLARRAGAHLQTLFIDEGFGTQDDDGRERLIEAITAIQEHFNLILVITHIEELRDSFPVHILIRKTNEGSHVSVR